MHEKRKLTIKEQINHMETAGVQFSVVSKEDAEKYLYSNTYFFKIKAYCKNYAKNKAGKYVNLDFGYLKELSIIDMRLRKLVLSICLQIEHFLKVEINKHFSTNTMEDGYSIIKEFMSSPFYVNAGMSKTKAKSHYNEDLILKYESDYSLWSYMEVISFGELIELYKFYFEKYEPKRAKLHNILYSAKHLRNACAHNNCVLNNIGKTIGINRSLVNILNKRTDFSPAVIQNKCKKIVVNDFVSLLYCYSEVVTSEGVKNNIRIEIEAFIERSKRNIEFFKTNDEILSLLNFFEKIVKIFA